MKKKFFGIICAIFMIGALTGCGANNNSNSDSNSGGNTAKIKGNCHAIECIKQITVDSTVSDINKIIGFDGELTDEKYNIYYWEISEDEGIKVAYYGGNKGTITADFDRDTLANSKVNFSRYSELQPRIKEGISYNDFKSYIGNVDGTITEKSSISTKYTWVSSDGSYLTASFSNSSNQCTFASGSVK